jgi:hypothetical protein
LKLAEKCEKEKNTVAKNLFVLVDFKMNWEAMYQREKTTDHFGKRGISWHGCRIEFYLWNKDLRSAESHVIKVDQIISGANKQDGPTVLGLLEALQAYCSVEFPEAEITYLQSDNASSYQSKTLVLGIPLLNDVSDVLFYCLLSLNQSVSLCSESPENKIDLRACYSKFCAHRNPRWQESP